MNIYYKTMKKAPPSSLLIEALLYCKGGEALDLGAGPLNDVKFLLDKGFLVTAVDKSDDIAAIAKSIDNKEFTYVQTTFEKFDFPPQKFDLISAQWSLSFNPPESFNSMFQKLKSSLKAGGIFCSQLYGIKDDWASRENMSFFEVDKIKQLLSGMEVIKLSEGEENINNIEGKTKHWHVFEVIAKKV
jgi:tellurite methyltransferase